MKRTLHEHYLHTLREYGASKDAYDRCPRWRWRKRSWLRFEMRFNMMSVDGLARALAEARRG